LGVAQPHRFDAGVLTMLLFDFIIIFGSGRMYSNASGRRRPGRTLIWVIVLLGSAVGLFAAAYVATKGTFIGARESKLCLRYESDGCRLCLVAHQCVVHLRYAHLYFRDDGSGEGGLEFRAMKVPDAMDFAYFSFTVGMCFQVSDVVITSK